MKLRDANPCCFRIDCFEKRLRPALAGFSLHRTYCSFPSPGEIPPCIHVGRELLMEEDNRLATLDTHVCSCDRNSIAHRRNRSYGLSIGFEHPRRKPAEGFNV